MNKAVLVLDEMPKGCLLCRFSGISVDGILVCDVDDMADHLHAEGEEASDRSDWCPLHELPDKQETRDDIDFEEGFAEGWNACLDEIIGKEEHG